MTENHDMSPQLSNLTGNRTETRGKVLLKILAPSLQARGVPQSSFVMVSISDGEFVTGKTQDETQNRFKLLHPGAQGWMQRLSELIAAPVADPQDDEASEEVETPASIDAKSRRAYASRSGRFRPRSQPNH